jgi:hypothetical protein
VLERPDATGADPGFFVTGLDDWQAGVTFLVGSGLLPGALLPRVCASSRVMVC